MNEADTLDALFCDAVAMISAGDQPALTLLLANHPQLAVERLEAPGSWLRDQIGIALEGFFQRPYLLWFVAEDPVRHGRLPANIAQVAQTIIDAIRRADDGSLAEQLEHALRLVCWSWIARECGVQIALIDVLLDAGATVDGFAAYSGSYGSHCDAAIYNGNLAAAEHLVARGATLTLTTALCLDRWDDVERMMCGATLEDKQNAFVQAALRGNAEALRRMLALGVDPTTVSQQNQSHGTALHHAVWSGSLDAVRTLAEAGADLTRRDTLYNGTPLNWAEHALQGGPAEGKQYREIAEYLREQEGAAGTGLP